MTLSVQPSDELTGRMLAAINATMIEMMAEMARKDYEQRRERQAQDLAKAKEQWLYLGRPANQGLLKHVAQPLGAKLGVRATVRRAGCSTTTVM